MTEVTLIGALAEPQMRAIWGTMGRPAMVEGRLTGGAMAGIDPDDWPILSEGQGEIAGWTVPEASITRYREAIGLDPVEWRGRRILGAVTGQPAMQDWTPRPDAIALAAEIARDMLRRPAPLRRIAPVSDARLRAATETTISTLLPPPGRDRVKIEAWSEPYGNFFAVEDWGLRHRLHDGGWSERMDRAVFVSGDASLLLPWDPVRDRVMLIDQFRVGPLTRGDRQCWMLEPIAGRVDALESPEQAARREAVEEAGIEVGRIFALPHFYSSPGGTSEVMYGFVGIADLPDGAERRGGLAEEGEDIRSHILTRAELMQMVETGIIVCGPLVTLALWLDRMASRWRDQIRES